MDDLRCGGRCVQSSQRSFGYVVGGIQRNRRVSHRGDTNESIRLMSFVFFSTEEQILL